MNNYIKHINVFWIIVISLLGISGCATSVHGTPAGFLYADQKGPVALSSNKHGQEHSYNGVTTSSAKCILGFVCWGDASIEAALQNSGVELKNTLVISHIDYEYKNIFGYVEYKTVVYYFNKYLNKSRRISNKVR